MLCVYVRASGYVQHNAAIEGLHLPELRDDQVAQRGKHMTQRAQLNEALG